MYKTAHQIADLVLRKVAQITNADIAAGLAGTPTREFTPEEQAELQQSYEDQARQQTRWGIPIAAAVGGGLGGVTAGYGIGVGVKGTLLGAGLGAGVGALAGWADRRGHIRDERNLAYNLGQVASTGHIPYGDLAGGTEVEELVPYATGIPWITQLDVRAEMDRAKKLRRDAALAGGLRGLAAGGLSGMSEDGDTKDVLTGALAGGALGASRQDFYTRDMYREAMDLRSRGYTDLADRLEAQL